MYEIERVIGVGAYSAYFSLRGHPNLGVKIPYTDGGHQDVIIDFKYGKKMFSQGLPVPRYAGFIEIMIPEHIDETIKRARERGINNTDSIIHPFRPGSVHKGLVIENINPDFSLISHERLKKIYDKEALKFNRYNIKIQDSGGKHNILWDPHRKKMYFIDYGLWQFPKDFEKRALPLFYLWGKQFVA